MSWDGLLGALQGMANTVWQTVERYLPGSPFQNVVSKFGEIPYLAEINWFIPVAEILDVMQVWLFAIGVFYGFSAIMRLANLID